MPRLPVYSLRAKLLLFSTALVIVPGIVFGVIAYVSAHRALENAVGRQLAEVAHDTAAEVTELIARERHNMRSWARQDVMREIVIGDLDKRISRFLTSLKESDIGYVDLLCTDATGRVVAATQPGPARHLASGPRLVPRHRRRQRVLRWLRRGARSRASRARAGRTHLQPRCAGEP